MRTENTLSRRELVWQGVAAAGTAKGFNRTAGPLVVHNKTGNFRFLRGIAPYSSGAIADKGFEVVHATLAPAPPYRRGFEALDRHLKQRGRPRQALCGIELRSPRPFTFSGFDEFNQPYVELLKERNLLLDGLNPVARTNVAPEVGAPSEVALYGFSYTAPATATRRTFVVAGAGELIGERLDARDIVQRGDVSPAGLRAKASHVLGLMDQRLQALGVEWRHVTVVEVYTVHSICELMRDLLLPRIGEAGVHGIRWHFARPPIEEIEFEMDLRGCGRELVL